VQYHEEQHMALKNREIHHYLIVNHSLSCIDGIILDAMEGRCHDPD
jgi:hypothetical protein